MTRSGPRIFRRTGLFPVLLLALFFAGTTILPAPVLAARSGNQLSPAQFAAVAEARHLLDEGRPADAAARLLPLTKGKRPPLAVLGHLAWAQAEAGDQDAALATYQRTADLYPEDAGAARNLGILLLEQGRYGRAATTLEQAHDLQPENGREPALLAMAAYALARLERFGPALKLLDRAEAEAGTSPVSWTSTAVHCCLRLGRTREAVTRCRACAGDHSEAPEAWTLLCRVLARDGDPLAAAAALETARALRRDRASGGTDEEIQERDRNTAGELAALYALGRAHEEAARCLAEEGTPESALLAAERLHLVRRNTAALAMLDQWSGDGSAEKAGTDRAAMRAALLRGRILRDLGRGDEAVPGLLKAARTAPAPAADREGQRLRGSMLLLAGEIRWSERNWTEAARIFTDLATVPGFGETGASLAAGMRAMIREAALTPAAP